MADLNKEREDRDRLAKQALTARRASRRILRLERPPDYLKVFALGAVVGLALGLILLIPTGNSTALSAFLASFVGGALNILLAISLRPRNGQAS